MFYLEFISNRKEDWQDIFKSCDGDVHELSTNMEAKSKSPLIKL